MSLLRCAVSVTAAVRALTLAGVAALLGAASLSAQAPAGGYTLQLQTNIVVLDVTVTGPDGHAVRGLKASDFTLTEDGKPQQIRSFSAYGTDAPRPTQPAATTPKLQPGFFTNYTPAPAEGPANVLLLDMLNTPLRDQEYARQQILDYLKHAQPGTRLAIFGLSNKLTILQGFTADPHLLAEALSHKNALKLSTLLDDPVGGGTGGAELSPLSDALANQTQSPDVTSLLANAQQFEAETQAYQQQERAQYTLDALNEIARYLATIPGRKNLIWFSGAFPTSILPDPSVNNGFVTATGTEAEFRETMALLTRNQVSLYPVDARGLTTSGVFNAASANSKYVRDPQAAGKDIAKYNARTAAENSTMLEAARETGGQAFINTNGLAAAVTQAVTDGANYYTLTYTPTNRREDGVYRRIELTLPGNKQAQLSYRRGYLADKAVAAKAGKDAAAAADQANADKSVITRSMVRGAPTPTQIQFTVRALRTTGAPESTAAAGNEPIATNPEAKPPYIRYAVDFAVDQRDLSFVQDGQNFRGDFQFVTFVYDVDGNLLNRAGSVIHADLTPARRAAFLQGPLAYSQDISVPRATNLFLRIAVYDLNNQHVGAVEIPVESIKNLPPLTPAK